MYMYLFSSPLNVATSLSYLLNSTRGYKHQYFYHFPLHKLAHNKCMMLTQVYVLYSSD